MGNTTGQGHKGISHPFGAKHDATPWREPRLEERMWPDFENMLGGKDAAIAADIRRGRADEAVRYDMENMFTVFSNNMTKGHDSEFHAGWKPYTPDLDATVPYCSVGVRPLDGLRNFYGIIFDAGHAEHQQVICHNGQNFGLSKASSSQDGLYIEKPDRLREYKVSPVKYRQDIILKAKNAVSAEWARLPPPKNICSDISGKPTRYCLPSYNCQHYIKDILTMAKKIADKEGVPLVLNSVNGQN